MKKSFTVMQMHMFSRAAHFVLCGPFENTGPDLIN